MPSVSTRRYSSSSAPSMVFCSGLRVTIRYRMRNAAAFCISGVASPGIARMSMFSFPMQRKPMSETISRSAVLCTG